MVVARDDSNRAELRREAAAAAEKREREIGRGVVDVNEKIR